MDRRGQCQSEGLLTAATALSIALSQGKTAEELAVLGAFFTVLGDSLSMLAIRAPSEEDCKIGTA